LDFNQNPRMRLGPLMILSKKATLGPSTRTQEDNIGLQPNPKNASRFFDDSLEEGNPWTFKREAKKATLGPSRGKRRMTTLDLQEGSKEGNLGPSRGKRRRTTLDLQEGSKEGHPWAFKREAKVVKEKSRTSTREKDTLSSKTCTLSSKTCTLSSEACTRSLRPPTSTPATVSPTIPPTTSSNQEQP